MKKLFAILITLVLVIGLNGCGGEKIPEGKTRLDLVIRLYGGAEKKIRREHYEKAIAEFNKLYPDYHVVINDIPGGMNDYLDKLTYKFQANEQLDVVWFNSGNVPQFYDSGLLSEIPFTEWEQFENFNQNYTSNFDFNGKYYYLPAVTDVRFMWYNKEAIKAAGYELPWQPETWEEIEEAARKMASNGVEYPMWEMGHTLSTFLTSTEDRLYDTETNQWVLSSQGLYDSFKFIEDVYTSKNFSDKAIATVTDSRSRDKGKDYILDGRVGIYLRGSWMEEDLKKRDENYDDIVGVAAVPKQKNDGYATFSGGWGWIIPSTTRDRDISFELVKILASYELNLDYTTNITNDMSVRDDVASNPDYLNNSSFKEQAASMLDFTEFALTDEFETVVNKALEEKIKLVAKGEITADEAIKQLIETLEPTIGKDKIQKRPYETR